VQGTRNVVEAARSAGVGRLAVVGPEAMWLGDAVERVAEAVGRRPIFVRAPVGFHHLIAVVAEAVMRVPLVSKAQVRILAEGITTAAPHALDLPKDLRPTTRFDHAAIVAGLPPPGPFTRSDLRLPMRCARMWGAMAG
jgi:NADH dehydrogenase